MRYSVMFITAVCWIFLLKIVFVEKTYTYLVIFSRVRSSSFRKSACLLFFGSVQKISRLDSQSKFQMFTLFTDRHDIGGPSPKEVLQHGGSIITIKLYNFAWNISTNISTLGRHTHLKLGE